MKFAKAINYFFALAPDAVLLAPPLVLLEPPPDLLLLLLLPPPPPLLLLADLDDELFPFDDAPPEDFDAPDFAPDAEPELLPLPPFAAAPLFPFAAEVVFDDAPPLFDAVFAPAVILLPPPPPLALLALLFDAEVFPAAEPLLLAPDFPAEDFAADDLLLDAVFAVPPVVFFAVEFWVVFFAGIIFFVSS